jgi:hypothetical protein
MALLAQVSITVPSVITDTVSPIVEGVEVTCSADSFDFEVTRLADAFFTVPAFMLGTLLALVFDEVFGRMGALAGKTIRVPC